MKTSNMKRLFLVLLILFLYSVHVYAGKKTKFPVSNIPKDLLTNASAVMRMKNNVFTRISPRKAVQKIDYAITILNKSGKYDGYFVQPYTRFSSVHDIKGTVYNADGKKVKTIKLEDINDASADFGRSLYSDVRIKYIDPDYDQYPYTVEYSCEVNYSGSLNLENWQVIPHYDMAIQKESFSMITPDDGDPNSPVAVRYYLNKKDIPLQHKVQNGKTIYSLTVNNIKAIQEEDFSPNLKQISPMVYFAPVSFTIAGYKGSMKSWNAFGSFIRNLNKGRDVLPKETQDKIKKLVVSKKTIEEKVDALYKYMQNKVRYVSIQKGIQSWQPAEAKTVDQVSYGDCKALTNYMHSLLNVVGIKSYYTLVRAGDDAMPVNRNFPSNQFDHAILCVPNGKDTIWLECTNQHIPPGYIGTFTDDRNVLIIGKDTAEIVRTKIYTAKQNEENTRTNVQIGPDGGGRLETYSSYSGSYYENMLGLMLADAQKQRLYLLKTIHLPTFQLKKYSFSEKKKELPVICSKVDVYVPNYGTHMGNLLLLRLFPMTDDAENSFRTSHRNFKILLRRSFAHSDTMVFNIPKGYKAVKYPSPKKLVKAFATYELSSFKQGNKLIFIRKLVIKRGEYPASKNPEFIKFFDEVNNLDGSKLVLAKM